MNLEIPLYPEFTTTDLPIEIGPKTTVNRIIHLTYVRRKIDDKYFLVKVKSSTDLSKNQSDDLEWVLKWFHKECHNLIYLSEKDFIKQNFKLDVDQESDYESILNIQIK